MLRLLTKSDRFLSRTSLRRQRQRCTLTVAPFFDGILGKCTNTGASPFRRHLSSTSRTQRQPNTINLDKFTRIALDVRKNALGTLTNDQWDEILTTMLHWLQLDGVDGSNESENTHAHSMKGTAVDSADRLLQRLLAEEAARSPVSRKRSSDLSPMLLATLQAWLEVSNAFPGVSMPIERSYALWTRLCDRKNRRLWKRPLPAIEFVALVESCLTADDARSTELAVSLLVSDEILEILEAHRERLVSCFHEARRQATVLGDKMVAQRVSDVMQDLSNRLEWNELRPEILDITTEKKSNKIGLSSFEQKALQKRTLSVVQSAKLDDADVVENIFDRWKEAPGCPDGLAEALIDFFVNSNEPIKATQSLQKMLKDQSYTSTEVVGRKVEQVISLWIRSGHSDAPWRAVEILKELEPLRSEMAVEIKDSVYVNIAQLWFESDYPRAGKQAFEILSKMQTFDTATFKMSTKALLKDAFVAEDDVAALDKLARRQWPNIEVSEVSEISEHILGVLIKAKDVKRSLRFVTFMVDNGSAVSARACCSVLELFSHELDPDKLLSLLSLLEKSDAELDFRCYEIVVRSLVGMRRKHRMEEIKSALFHLFRRVGSGALEVSADALGSLIYTTIDVVLYFQRDRDALEILEAAEGNLLKGGQSGDLFPVPLKCYERITELLAAKEQTEELTKIFERVQAYQEKGYNNIFLSTNLCTQYMKVLSKRGRSSLKKREELLDDLIYRYELTQRADCKPSDRMFHGIIHTYKTNVTLENAERVTYWLDRMLQLGVETYDCFAFSSATYMLIESRAPRCFTRVQTIFEKLENAGVKPDKFILRDVLRACLRADKVERDIARVSLFKTLSKVRESKLTDLGTYEVFFRALKVCLPAKDRAKDELVSRAFELCCDDGFLSPPNTELIQGLVSANTWRKMYESSLINYEEPHEWSRNVKK